MNLYYTTQKAVNFFITLSSVFICIIKLLIRWFLVVTPCIIWLPLVTWITSYETWVLFVHRATRVGLLIILFQHIKACFFFPSTPKSLKSIKKCIVELQNGGNSIDNLPTFTQNANKFSKLKNFHQLPINYRCQIAFSA